MTVQSRLYQFFGGSGKTLPELEQTATPVISPAYSVFTVTGTTAITGFSTSSQIMPGRNIVLIGTHATGPAFTDTAIASTANGKIHLSAALTLAAGTTVSFVQNSVGAWLETARAANG